MNLNPLKRINDKLDRIEKEQKALIIINEKILEGLTFLTKTMGASLKPESTIDEVLYDQEQAEFKKHLKKKKVKNEHTMDMNELLMEAWKY